MDVLHEVVCGLDVHKEVIVACVREARAGTKATRETRSFEAHSRGLREMKDWLTAKQVTVIVMEGTGIYWRPVYAVLESEPWEQVVCNAHHVKNVPGRKTDVKDAEWLAQLVQHGLIRPSFVPPPEVRLLRDLVRSRKKMVENRSQLRERVLKVLAAANIKLDGVATDAFGVSGMLMLRAMATGAMTAKQMAALAKGTLRKKMDALEVALDATLHPVHQKMLSIQLDTLEAQDKAIRETDEVIKGHCEPWRDIIERLKTVPGFDWVMAVSVLAEVGPDLATFPTESHLASWTGVCPGNNESAGKSRDGRPQRGNPYLKTMLCQAALSAAHTKGSYLRDKFYRVKARRGAKKAVMAIAHKLVFAVFHIIKDGCDFKELGADWLDRRNPARIVRGLVERIESLGYTVNVQSHSLSGSASA